MTSQMLTQRLNQSASPMGAWGLVRVLLVAAVLAVLFLFGLIAVTTSPILVSMAAALLVGAFLLAKKVHDGFRFHLFGCPYQASAGAGLVL